MRILLLSPNQQHRYNWGHQLLRNEIGKQNDVKYYGEGYPGYNKNFSVKKIINKTKWTPDVILTYGWRYTLPFKGLGDISIPKVHIAVDYAAPKIIKQYNSMFKEHKYDLMFAITLAARDRMNKNKVINNEIQILPFAVDTNLYKPLNLPKKNQILAAFNTRPDIYPYRSRAQQAARQTGYPVIVKRIVQRALINSINSSKICLTSNNKWHSFSMKYTEYLACGGFLLADKPAEMDYLGYVNKKHFVIYNGMSDLKDKIRYFMKHDAKREEIAKQGMKFVRNNHSCEVRVKEMTKIIKEELNV